MKRVCAIVLSSVLLMMLFSGCGIKEKINQEVGEAIGGKVLEKIAGDDVDIDLDDDSIVIEGSDGVKMNFGSGKWPDSDLAKAMPEYQSGEITSVIESTDFIQVVISESDESYLDNYLDKIKAIFDTDVFESKSDDSFGYTGTDDKNHTINIFVDGDECIISLNKNE